MAANPVMLRDIPCLFLAERATSLRPSLVRAILPFPLITAVTALKAGLNAPEEYCAISSIELNINLGKGIMGVRPLRVMKLLASLNTFMSGALA